LNRGFDTVCERCGRAPRSGRLALPVCRWRYGPALKRHIELVSVLVNAGRMTVEQAAFLVTSLRDGEWLHDEEAALAKPAALGLTAIPGAVTELSSGLIQRELETALAIDQASLSTLDTAPTSVIFFIGASPEPGSVETKEAYESLIASLSVTLGKPQRVWEDQPTPLEWSDTEVDVGVQLFDRRDTSVVMVWVEHRLRSQEAERRARVNRNAH